jgi:hypothetical protein
MENSGAILFFLTRPTLLLVMHLPFFQSIAHFDFKKYSPT